MSSRGSSCTAMCTRSWRKKGTMRRLRSQKMDLCDFEAQAMDEGGFEVSRTWSFGGLLRSIRTWNCLNLRSTIRINFDLRSSYPFSSPDKLTMLSITTWASALAIFGTALAGPIGPNPPLSNNACTKDLGALGLSSSWASKIPCTGNAQLTCSVLQQLFPKNETFSGGSQYYQTLVDVP